MPQRRMVGSTNKASSSASPSTLGNNAANPAIAPFCSNTNTVPAAICSGGNSIASGWASNASRSPTFVRDARLCRSSRSFCSETAAGRMRNFSISSNATESLTRKAVVLQVSMQTGWLPSVCRACLGCQLEKAVDELNLSKKIISCHPSSLPLLDHVDCFVALNRSPSRLKFSEALLRIHPTFDRSMILFENVCSSTAPVGVDSGCVASRPSYCRGSAPGQC